MDSNAISVPTSRRGFLKKTCSAIVAMSLATGSVALVGCDSSGSNPPELPAGITLNGNTMTVDLTQFPTLTAPRGSLWVANQDVFIVHVEADTYQAFSSICPHEQEDVNIYEPANGSNYQLRCPAHNWTFDLDGGPTGSAEAGLPRFSVTKDENTLLVTIDR